eukprot:scaffold4833_cov164-Pinguiococcus_pyrenoidosus.AAC.2
MSSTSSSRALEGASKRRACKNFSFRTVAALREARHGRRLARIPRHVEVGARTRASSTSCAQPTGLMRSPRLPDAVSVLFRWDGDGLQGSVCTRFTARIATGPVYTVDFCDRYSPGWYRSARSLPKIRRYCTDHWQPHLMDKWGFEADFGAHPSREQTKLRRPPFSFLIEKPCAAAQHLKASRRALSSL